MTHPLPDHVRAREPRARFDPLVGGQVHGHRGAAPTLGWTGSCVASVGGWVAFWVHMSVCVGLAPDHVHADVIPVGMNVTYMCFRQD